tara:strand:- start:665 stop:1036 length:372 start_codon:yes stop_codon:yes gene_type:complete
MYKNLFFPLLIILFVFSCEEPINKNDSNEEALKAFSKIDDKSANLFTQEDRKNKYKNSVVRNLDKKESLNENISYNGYGSINVNKVDNNTTTKNKTNKPKSKKKTYSYKTGSSPQAFSAYSTN